MRRQTRLKFLYILSVGMLSAYAFSANAQKQEFSIFAGTMVESTWQEVQAAAQQHAIVLLPVSVVEEHGPHLDLSPDIYLTSMKCALMKHALEAKGRRVVIAPPMYWGINASTGTFPGSFTVSETTFAAILSDMLACLKTWGFSDVYCVNLHGDPTHRRVLQQAITAGRESLNLRCYTLDELPHVTTMQRPKVTYHGYAPDYHAGAHETNAMYEFFPGKVEVETAQTLQPQSQFAPEGYVGDPANFRKGIGKAYFEDEAQYDAERVSVFYQTLAEK